MCFTIETNFETSPSPAPNKMERTALIQILPVRLVTLLKRYIH